MTDIVFLRAMYGALRATKRENFDENDYFWKIGVKVLKELETQCSNYMYYLLHGKEGVSPTLYGIRVEIDYVDVDSIHLYEDITYKIEYGRKEE